MLGVGWTEMLVIGIVALVVIGPKELPSVMRKVGQFAATIRRMGGEFQRELNKTTGLNEIANLRNSVTAPLKATADAIRKEFNTTTPTGEVKPSGVLKPADPKVESVVDEIKAAAGMAPAAIAPLTGPANPISTAATTEASTPVAPAPVVAKSTETKPTAKRTVRAKIKAPAPSAPVAVADIPPAKKPPRPSRKVTAEAPVDGSKSTSAKDDAAAAKVAADAAAPKAPSKAKKPAAPKKPAADKKP